MNMVVIVLEPELALLLLPERRAKFDEEVTFIYLPGHSLDSNNQDSSKSWVEMKSWLSHGLETKPLPCAALIVPEHELETVGSSNSNLS